MPAGEDHRVHVGNSGRGALLQDVHRRPGDRFQPGERVSHHAGGVDPWHRQVGTERSQLGTDVRQRCQEVDLMAVGPQLQCQADPLPAALSVVDDHHVPADRLVVLENVPDRQHVLLVQAGCEGLALREIADDVRSGGRAGGHDDVIGPQLQYVVGAGCPAQPQVHAVFADHHVEVVDDTADFFTAPDPFGDAQLPAGTVAALDEDDLVSLPGGDLGGLHAGRTGPDHHDAAPEGGLDQGARTEFLLVTGGRIMHTRRMGDGEQPVDAALVAADAAADLVEPPFGDLVDGFRVGDLLAGHGHQVGVAEVEDIGGIVRIVDPADRDDGDVHDGFHRGGQALPDSLRVLHVRHVLVCLVVCGGLHADVVDLAGRGDGLGDLLGVPDGQTARAEIVALQIDADQVVGSDLVAHRVDHPQYQAHPVLQ